MKLDHKKLVPYVALPKKDIIEFKEHNILERNFLDGMVDVVSQIKKTLDDHMTAVLELYGYSKDDAIRLFKEKHLTGYAGDISLYDTVCIIRMDGTALFACEISTKLNLDEYKWTTSIKTTYYITPEEWKERKGEKE